VKPACIFSQFKRRNLQICVLSRSDCLESTNGYAICILLRTYSNQSKRVFDHASGYYFTGLRGDDGGYRVALARSFYPFKKWDQLPVGLDTGFLSVEGLAVIPTVGAPRPQIISKRLSRHRRARSLAALPALMPCARSPELSNDRLAWASQKPVAWTA